MRSLRKKVRKYFLDIRELISLKFPNFLSHDLQNVDDNYILIF